MLKTNQIGAIRKFMIAHKITTTDLAKELDVNRSYLSMVLNGTMSNLNVENKVVEWYKNKK